MLGLRFSRLVHAAIASGALLLGGCQSGTQDTDGGTDTDTGSTGDEPTTTAIPPVDPPPPPPPQGDITPPALVSAVLLDPQTLQLTFTEPVAPVDAVNPKRFRLSVARAYSGGNYGDPGTYLVDPRFYNHEYSCPPPAPPCYYDPAPYYCYYDPYCYYQQVGPILVADLVNAADPSMILLELTAPILHSMCQLIETLNNHEATEVVLHLHYAAGGQAQITDLAGIPLPGLGEAWVKTDEYFHHYAGEPFASLSPFVPIPCPF